MFKSPMNMKGERIFMVYIHNILYIYMIYMVYIYIMIYIYIYTYNILYMIYYDIYILCIFPSISHIQSLCIDQVRHTFFPPVLCGPERVFLGAREVYQGQHPRIGELLLSLKTSSKKTCGIKFNGIHWI